MSLSVCIPTYNRSDALRSLLQSLCTEVDFHRLEVEIVVSDNCSEDDTKGVVSDYSSRFDFIRYFCNDTNVGGTRNFNLAILRSSGTHSWLLGDDTLLYPGAVKHLLDIIGQYPDAPVVFLGGNNQPKSKPIYLREQFAKHGTIFPIDDKSSFLSSMSIQEIGCISELVVHRKSWLETSYTKLPSIFIYPQICSILELMCSSTPCVYSHRLSIVNTRANDDHNLWYLDRAPLSILLEWPWYRQYAEDLGFENSGKGFFESTTRWKLHQAILIAGYHPYYQSAYKDICRMEGRWEMKILLQGIFRLAPCLKPIIRRRFKQRYEIMNLDGRALDFPGLPNLCSFRSDVGEARKAMMGLP